MRRVLTATVVALLAGSIGLRGDDTAARWWSHVEALANDGMEGRNTGSAGAQARGRLRGGAVQEVGSRTGRRRRLHPAGRLQDAADRRGQIEPGAGEERQDRAADARRGRQHQRAGRSRAGGRRAARVRRLRPEHPGAPHQRLRRRRSQGRHRRATSRPRRSRCRARCRRISDRPPSAGRCTRPPARSARISIANPKSMDIPWARSTLARLQPAMSLADAALRRCAGPAAGGRR